MSQLAWEEARCESEGCEPNDPVSFKSGRETVGLRAHFWLLVAHLDSVWGDSAGRDFTHRNDRLWVLPWPLEPLACKCSCLEHG